MFPRLVLDWKHEFKPSAQGFDANGDYCRIVEPISVASRLSLRATVRYVARIGDVEEFAVAKRPLCRQIGIDPARVAKGQYPRVLSPSESHPGLPDLLIGVIRSQTPLPRVPGHVGRQSRVLQALSSIMTIAPEVFAPQHHRDGPIRGPEVNQSFNRRCCDAEP